MATLWSDGGRALAGAITSVKLDTPTSNLRKLPSYGAFLNAVRCAGIDRPLMKDNVDSTLDVIRLHKDAAEDIQPNKDFDYLKQEARGLLGACVGARREPRLSKRSR